jgi:hypothetical protein
MISAPGAEYRNRTLVRTSQVAFDLALATRVASLIPSAMLRPRRLGVVTLAVIGKEGVIQRRAAVVKRGLRGGLHHGRVDRLLSARSGLNERESPMQSERVLKKETGGV